MVMQAETYIARVPHLTRLKEVRESKWLSQRELAELAHVSPTTVVRLENQQVEARFATVRALAEALGVEPKELV